MKACRTPRSFGREFSLSWDDQVALADLTESDVTLVRIACMQTVASVTKLAAAGNITTTHVACAEAAVHDVLSLLYRAAVGARLTCIDFDTSGWRG